MFFVAPFIIGFLLAAILLFSSCLIKIFVKVGSFAGFCAGICCSVVISLIISIYMGVVLYLFWPNPQDAASAARQQASTIRGIESFTRGALFAIWLFIAGLLVIVFAIIYLFTKRVSQPESEYNSVLMFASGFVFLPTIFFFLGWFAFLFSINKGMEIYENTQMTEEEEARAVASVLGTIGSAFLTLFEIVFFFIMLSFAGTIIMVTLHHRKLNSFVIWISLGCFFGPALFVLLFFLTYNYVFIEYPIALPTLASFGLGVFFYLKYSDEATRGEPLTNQQNYELSS